MKPVFLVHGFLGYRKFFIWELFPGVVERLRQDGIPAYQPLIHPTASIQERAQDLREYIDQQIGFEESYHIIGHSMGGLDARYLASPNGLNQGHRILSITTLSTPHYGSCYAENFPPPIRKIVSFLSYCMSYLMWREKSRRFLRLIGDKKWDALDQLQPHYMINVFNEEIIDHPEVRYFSYAARLKDMKSIFHNFPRYHPWRIIYKREGDNDSLVSVQSAKWGEFKGIVTVDHGGIIGLKIYPWERLTFGYMTFLRGIVSDLAELERNEEFGVISHSDLESVSD